MKIAGSNVRQSKGDRYTLEERGSTFPIRIVRLRLPTSHHQVAYTYMQRAARAQALDFVPFRCLSLDPRSTISIDVYDEQKCQLK